MDGEQLGTGADGLPVLAFPDAAAWERWLLEHGDTARGAWLAVAKKAATAPAVTRAGAVEVALCHGWIDGQLGRWDETRSLQRYTPRRPASAWSRVNRDAVERLLAAGRVAPAGLAAVERARSSGAWERAYEPASTATVPADLQAALDADPAAAAAFAGLDAANRYAVLYRVQQAGRPATRAQRIERFVAMLARGEVLHPRRAGGPDGGQDSGPDGEPDPTPG